MGRRRSKALDHPIPYLPSDDPAWLEANGYTYSHRKGADALLLVQTQMKLWKGEKAGQPFDPPPWAKFTIRALFGWMRKDGTRRFREAFVFVPRKNAKTHLAAAVALLLLVADKENAPYIASAAEGTKSAELCFDCAKHFVQTSPLLSSRIEILAHALVSKFNSGLYEPVSSRYLNQFGQDVHGIVFDELHTQRDTRLWDTLETGRGARRQPLIFAITTAGENKTGKAHDLMRRGERLRDKVVPIQDDPHFFYQIFKAEEEDDWEDEKVWYKANPSLGITIRIEYLREEHLKAKQDANAQNAFRTFYLNQWLSSGVRWMDAAHWRACADPDFKESSLAGRLCYGGLDLAQTEDLAALAWVFPPNASDPFWRALVRYWVPEDNLQTRTRRDKVPYLKWAAEGHITATPGSVIDYDVILADIRADAELFEVAKLGYDRWGATQISNKLMEDGLEIVGFGQGYASMSGPTKSAKVMVIKKEIRHRGDPVTTWNIDNVVTTRDAAENIKPNKEKSTEKIDGAVALIMALGVALAEMEEPDSVYDQKDRGFISV